MWRWRGHRRTYVPTPRVARAVSTAGLCSPQATQGRHAEAAKQARDHRDADAELVGDQRARPALTMMAGAQVRREVLEPELESSLLVTAKLLGAPDGEHVTPELQPLVLRPAPDPQAIHLRRDGDRGTSERRRELGDRGAFCVPPAKDVRRVGEAERPGALVALRAETGGTIEADPTTLFCDEPLALERAASLVVRSPAELVELTAARHLKPLAHPRPERSSLSMRRLSAAERACETPGAVSARVALRPKAAR